MTFSEWTATYCNCMLREGDTAEDRLVRQVAREAWKAAEAATREEMLAQWNHTGVDIDAALHGRVNEQSPIAGRLRMIAAAQPQWRPIATAPKDGRPVMLRRNIALTERISNGAYITDLTGGYWMWRHIAIGQPTHWMPLPPAPEKTTTGEKEQEARDVTR